MARFCGMIGFVVTEETCPGVWSQSYQERKYYGDIFKSTRRWENGVSINDNLNVSNRVSIVADTYAWQHLGWMRYVTMMGAKWKITDIEVQRPRLVLSIGGLYNVSDENGDSDDLGNSVRVE